MSRPDKFDNPWADNGGDVTPDFTTAKRDVGFVGGDIPAIEDFNILNREEQLHINDIINEGPGSWYPDAADISKMICSGQWDESWGSPADSLNIISGGAKGYHDLNVHFDSDSSPYLIALDDTNTTIEIYNARTKALVITTNPLTDDLPSGGGETYTCVSMCTDNTNIYVVLTDTNAAPDEHWIQAWTIDLTSANWSIVSGWPATGTQLTGTGSGPKAKLRDAKVIVADDTYLAVSCGWTTVTAAGDPAIQLYAIADGTLADDGAGDCPTGVSAQPSEAIASDGTNIFFGAHGGTSSYLCTATIADLTAGSGGTGYPLTKATSTLNDLCACGVGGAVFSTYDITGGAENDVILRGHNASDAVLLSVERGASANGVTGYEWSMDEPRDMFFDGMNLWTLAMITNGASSEEQITLVKIDLSKLTQIAVASPIYLNDYASVFVVNPLAETLSAGDAENMYLSAAFDSRDVWVNIEPRTGQTYTGEIYRLPRAVQRY